MSKVLSVLFEIKTTLAAIVREILIRRTLPVSNSLLETRKLNLQT